MCSPFDPMAMACTPTYWTNKRRQPFMQAVSQLSLSQAPRSFGAPYHGFPVFLAPSNCLKTAKLRRLSWGHCIVFLGRPLYSHSPSLHSGVYLGVSAKLMLWIIEMITLGTTSIPSRGSRNTPSCFMVQRPGQAPA